VLRFSVLWYWGYRLLRFYPASLCWMAPEFSKELQKIIMQHSSVACLENGKHNDAVTDSNNNNKNYLSDSVFDVYILQIEDIFERILIYFRCKNYIKYRNITEAHRYIFSQRGCPTVRSYGMWQCVACYISVTLYLHLQDQAAHTDYHARICYSNLCRGLV
jgi:hypothetical protein